jgi:hypothetical protein
MIKKIIGILLLFITITFTSVNAKEIEFALYYSPGGGADNHSNILVSALKKQNIAVKKRFFKTCVEALNYVTNTPNAYLVGLANDLQASSTGKCPGLQPQYTEIKLYTTIGDIPTMFCTSPKSTDITWSTLTDSSRQILVGTLTADANWIPFHLFLKHSKESLNIKVIPYKGASDVKIAAYAGNIDMFYIGGGVPELIEKGSRCLASSTKENWLNATFIGNLTTLKDFPETGIQTAIFSNGTIPKDLDSLMRITFASEQFLKDLADNNISHSGLGVGRSSEEQAKAIEKINHLFNHLKK